MVGHGVVKRQGPHEDALILISEPQVTVDFEVGIPYHPLRDIVQTTEVREEEDGSS